jgi:hypothetical protein
VAMDESIPDSGNSLARTPALRKLAVEGTRFAFLRGFALLHAHGAALTMGRSPAALHMTYLGESKKDELAEVERGVFAPKALAQLSESKVASAELPSKGGSAAAQCGKRHLGKVNPGLHGFDEKDGPNTNSECGFIACRC